MLSNIAVPLQDATAPQWLQQVLSLDATSPQCFATSASCDSPLSGSTVSTAEETMRSCQSRSSRSTESNGRHPAPKTPDFALPNREGSISPKVDSESSETRRCLVKQLGDAQVFDMADEDSPTDFLGEQDSAADFLAGTPTPTRNNVRRSSYDLASRANAPKAPTRPSGDIDSPLQCDAWGGDDWVSPARALEKSNLAGAFDRMQQQFAEAVASELQMDLQSQVQHAINQMSSWISEEITFARRGFEEDLRKACECSEADCARNQQQQQQQQQQQHVELNLRVEQLQASFDQQKHTFQKLKEDTCNWTLPQASSETHGPPPSSRVLEARAVADERKWRLKLDELQGGLDRHTERMEGLEKQSSYLMEKSNGQDTNVTDSISAVQFQVTGLQAQVTAARLATEKGLESCVQTVETHSKDTKDFASRLAILETAIKVTATQVQTVEDGFRKEARELAEKMTHHTAYTSSKIQDLAESFSKEARGLAETVVAQDDTMKEATIQLQKLEDRFQNFEIGATGLAEKVAKHDVNVDDFATQLCTFQETLGNEVMHVAENVAAHNSCIKDSAIQIRGLEQRYGEKTLQLARMGEKVGEHSTSIKEIARKLARHELDNVFQHKTLEAALESSSDSLEGLKAQVSASQKERLAELQVVCGKLENHEAQLLSLPSQLRTQLLASKEGLVRAMSDLRNDLRLGQTELAEQLSGKAHLADVHKLQASMQAWIEDARSAHQATLEQLTVSLQQSAASNKEHDSTLEKHGDWMKEVSAFLVQSQEREQGLSHILYRIVEEDYSELTQLFQEAMTTSH